jgi:hypothetical protein
MENKTPQGKWGALNPEKRKEIVKRSSERQSARWATDAAFRAKKNKQARESQWRSYGILNVDGTTFTSIDYDRAYQVQSGRCLGCDRHQTEFKDRLSADHDHVTKIFRGLLCQGCNLICGNAYDNPNTLERLSKYLRGDNE